LSLFDILLPSLFGITIWINRKQKGVGKMDLIRRFFTEEEGNDAIEYALIALLIAVAIIVAAGNVGDALNAAFGNVVAALN
jgi:pilus assembly protein Flp/PilA